MEAPEAAPYINGCTWSCKIIKVQVNTTLHLMHLKLQNYKSPSEHKFTLDAFEVAKF
jgi:hypothetical protein